MGTFIGMLILLAYYRSGKWKGKVVGRKRDGEM
jgi:hypothetical protein